MSSTLQLSADIALFWLFIKLLKLPLAVTAKECLKKEISANTVRNTGVQLLLSRQTKEQRVVIYLPLLKLKQF